MSKNVKIQNQVESNQKLQPTDFSVSVKLPSSANHYNGVVNVILYNDSTVIFSNSFVFVNSVVIDNYVQTAFQQYQNS